MNAFYMTMMLASLCGAVAFLIWGMSREANNKTAGWQIVGIVACFVLFIVFMYGADRTRPEPKPETFTCTIQIDQPKDSFTCTKDPR